MSLLQFLDFEATDFTTVYPDIQPGIGGVWFLRWDAFNPAEGQYNTKPITDWLEAESHNRLQDGTPKPLIMFLMVHSAPKGDIGADYTPEWVKRMAPTVTVYSARNGAALMPAYNKAIWWQSLAPAVRALGKAIDGHAQIQFQDIGIGCDGETWPMKEPWRAYIPSGTERMFGIELVKLLDVYREAFTQTPLLIRATPGSGRRTFITEAIARGIGYHMCGLQAGAQNYHGWGNEYGTMDGIRDCLAAGLPVAMESTSGLPDRRSMYWALHYALGIGGPSLKAIDVHPDWFQRLEAEYWNDAAANMGRSAAEAEMAWVVLRDYAPEYAPVQWTGSNGVVSGQSDWQGNFSAFMRADGDMPRVVNMGPVDALEYPQCRRVNSGQFSIDDSFAPDAVGFDLRIRWLQEPGATITVDDYSETRMLRSNDSNDWAWESLTIHARSFTIDGGAAIHAVYASPIYEQPEPPPPPVDWTGMTAQIDAAETRIQNAWAYAAEAASNAQAAMDEATAAKAQLEALRGMMEAAQ